MDHLITKTHEILYKLVEYTNRPGSQLILIGIANSLNLLDRFLPPLKGKAEPHRVSFNPYTTEEIIDIIAARLQILEPNSTNIPMIEEQAIELCARKVSAATGDIRMALDICRKSIELLESEYISKQQPLQENNNLQSPSPSPIKRRRITDVSHLPCHLKVSPMHIMRVTKALGSAQSFHARLRGLPVHHKAILCTLALLKTPSPTLFDVYDKYVKLCRRDGMLDAISRGEFLDACKQLDSIDIISIGKTNKGRKTVDKSGKGGLSIQEVDVLQAISGMEMLARFFEE